jgi:ribosomal protein S18 acetylase RimI-like enzyme
MSGITIRPYVAGQDDTIWVDIHNRARAEAPEFVTFTLAEMAQQRARPWFKAAGRFIAEIEGEPAGTVHAYLGDDAQMRVGDVVGPNVVPEARRRGVGSALMERAIADLRGRGATGVECGAGDWNQAGLGLASKFRFEPSHTYSTMERPVLPIPEGVGEDRTVRIVPMGKSDEEIATYHRIAQAAFAEYHNHERSTLEDWAWFIRHQGEDGRIIENYFALDAGEPVGFCVLGIEPTSNAQLGKKRAWVYDIGVLKEARGRGIGTRMLLHLLERAAARGMETMALGVDDQNVTRARRVYERVGFRLIRRFQSFELQFEPRPAG